MRTEVPGGMWGHREACGLGVRGTCRLWAVQSKHVKGGVPLTVRRNRDTGLSLQNSGDLAVTGGDFSLH